MTDTNRIPTTEIYRNVGIHDFQPRDRIETVVKPAIDAVFGITDPATLVRYAANRMHPPEARLLAAARVEAAWELAAESRENRPAVDLAYLRAVVAGLDSLHWMDPRHFGSLLEPGLSPDQVKKGSPPARKPEDTAAIEQARARQK